ncbi:MAG TPA: filamentous hemagglutinin N-terminal domain-containing protein [Thiotrichaceae bacterium]|nr:filamentous hemagglutinin N-terminal domain-containing protein [Thiotrichaceae bacterium]
MFLISVNQDNQRNPRSIKLENALKIKKQLNEMHHLKRITIMTTPSKLLSLIISITLLSSVQAQIITDGTVGRADTLTGPNYIIGDDLGSQRGQNLFHSFQDFNVNTGESAQFTGPASINNVFSRVTGGRDSFIDGKISSTMPNADLYLINPSGIMFGEHASLNVPASFYASTADQIILKDGTRFDATTPGTTPILSAEPFESFGFLDDTQAPVSVKGSFLEVSEGRTLGLVGGDVNISSEAELSSGGQIQIESQNQAKLGNISVDNSRVTAAGRIFFRAGKLVFGNNSRVKAFSSTGKSQIEIDANVLNINNSSFFTKESESDNLHAGDILITATKSVTLSGKSKRGDEPTISVATSGQGDAGSISIETPTLEIIGGAEINAQTTASGKGGTVRIEEADNVTLKDNSNIIVTTSGNGNAGFLSINTNNLTLTNNSSIRGSTTGSGKGANIQIQAKNSIELSEQSWIAVATDGSGDAGLLNINTDTLDLKKSSIAAGILLSGTGNGNLLQINANNIRLSKGEIPFKIDPLR